MLYTVLQLLKVVNHTGNSVQLALTPVSLSQTPTLIWCSITSKPMYSKFKWFLIFRMMKIVKIHLMKIRLAIFRFISIIIYTFLRLMNWLSNKMIYTIINVRLKTFKSFQTEQKRFVRQKYCLFIVWMKDKKLISITMGILITAVSSLSSILAKVKFVIRDKKWVIELVN